MIDAIQKEKDSLIIKNQEEREIENQTNFDKISVVLSQKSSLEQQIEVQENLIKELKSQFASENIKYENQIESLNADI